MRDTLQDIGERIRHDVKKGGVGAYYVEDKYNYYLGKWTETPWKVEEDMTVQNPGGNALTLFKGEYVCRMTWFNYVPHAPMWYTPSTTKVLFECSMS